MTTPSGQLDAPNFLVDASNGITYGYRRFGHVVAGWLPLLCMQHFRGTIDSWDALFIDTVAESREVILFDNTGVGHSSGTVPPTITAMARDAIAFADALGLTETDLLGYSIGGMVAQEFTLLRPRMVRRLILAATGPQGSPHQMHGWITDVADTANAANNGPDDLLRLFFEITQTSRDQGSDYLARFLSRTEGRDTVRGPAVQQAQYDAITEWGIPDPSRLNRLAGITQPVLVASGSNDTMIPVINAQLLADRLPNARLRIYPDAGHGFLFQYPLEFAQLIATFLDTAHP